MSLAQSSVYDWANMTPLGRQLAIAAGAVPPEQAQMPSMGAGAVPGYYANNSGPLSTGGQYSFALNNLTNWSPQVIQNNASAETGSDTTVSPWSRFADANGKPLAAFNDGTGFRVFSDPGDFGGTGFSGDKLGKMAGVKYDRYDANGKYIGNGTFDAKDGWVDGGIGDALGVLSVIAMAYGGGALADMAAGAGAGAGAAAGAGAGAGAGALDLGGGIVMGADGAITGATPFVTSGLTNAGILDSIGASGLGAGGVTSAMGAGTGTLDLGGGITMGADGSIGGAMPFSTSTLSNAGILDSVGASALNTLPPPVSPGGTPSTSPGTTPNSSLIPGVPNSTLGALAPVVGGLLGSQPNTASTAKTLPAFLQAPVAGDLVPRTQGLLASQMPLAQSAGQAMVDKGTGLLSSPVAGNGVGQVKLNAPTTNTNPYLGAMADDISLRTQKLLGANNLAIQGNAVASGGMGGSRMGVAQGIAAGNAADTLQGQLANLYGTQYSNDQNRALQQYGLDQSFFTGQRGQDLAQVGIGSGLQTQGLQTQWSPINSAANTFSPFTGFGTTTASQGGGLQGALGGALGAAQLGKNLSWW